MPPTRAAPLSNGPDETHVDRVHLQVTRDADRPSKIASREALAKRRAQPVTCICQHTTEAHAGARFLERLRSEPDLDWTFLSPSADFAPGERTGRFGSAAINC